MGESLIEQMRGEVGGPSREEVQRAFDNIGAQIDEIADATDQGGTVAQALFSPRDVALVMLECSLQLEVIRELDAENDRAFGLVCQAKEHLIDMEAEKQSLMHTIFQTWCYLGRYKNDADDATHAKRLLQNCLLVRGSDKVKIAVKQKMLAPPPEKWWKRVWASYLCFAISVSFFAYFMGGMETGWALYWIMLAVGNAVDVARHAAKGGAHVQTV